MSWIEQQIERLMRGQAAGFRELLTEALREPDSLSEAIEALEEIQLESIDDARLTIRLLRHLPLESEDRWQSPHYTVMGWLEDASEGAWSVLRVEAAGELLRIYDSLVDRLSDETDVLAVASDALSVLKVLVLYRIEGALHRLVAAAQHPVLQNAYLWSSVFEAVDGADAHEAEEGSEHAWRFEINRLLGQGWPDGFARLAFLDHVNRMAWDGEISGHPFDDARGHEALADWLEAGIEVLPGAARSAATALAFLNPSAQAALLDKAEAHPETTVRIEAAGVRASLGDAMSIERLRSWAEDPRFSVLAVAHLEQVGAVDVVPPTSQGQDFRAAATMASWLAQPSEFNRPPDDLVAVDSRELHWPPTDDRRQVWLFRYRYWPVTPDDPSFEGLGMVGSVTFAMADEDTEDLSIPEAYGLHCAFELEMMDDSRAPPVRDALAGLRILRESNPDL